MTREEFTKKWAVRQDDDTRDMLLTIMSTINESLNTYSGVHRDKVLTNIFYFCSDYRAVLRAEEQAQEQAYEDAAHRAFYSNEK